MVPAFCRVQRCAGAAGFGGNGGGEFGPDEGFRRLVVFGEIGLDGGLQGGDAGERAAADAFSCDLGEEALDQIEPGRAGRREVQMEARMLSQPCFHGGSFVSAVIVDDQMQREACVDRCVDRAQEFDEFARAMAWLAFADHKAAFDIKRGEQSRCAVTLIIMRHGFGAALFQRQAGLGAIERLDLTFLIDAQHQRAIRRVQIEADNVFDFFFKQLIIRQFEAARLMWLRPRCGPRSTR